MVLGDVVALSSLPMSFDDGMIMEKNLSFLEKNLRHWKHICGRID